MDRQRPVFCLQYCHLLCSLLQSLSFFGLCSIKIFVDSRCFIECSSFWSKEGDFVRKRQYSFFPFIFAFREHGVLEHHGQFPWMFGFRGAPSLGRERWGRSGSQGPLGLQPPPRQVLHIRWAEFASPLLCSKGPP